MAIKKALVLGTNGYPQQLQSGDTLEGIASSQDEISLTNASGGTVAPGSVVYISAANSFQPSRANAAGTAKIIGLTTASAAASASVAVRKDGTLSLTTTQWDAVTGQTGGLTAGSDYWLSDANAGRLITTVPTSGFVVKVGVAISTTDFELDFGDPIQL